MIKTNERAELKKIKWHNYDECRLVVCDTKKYLLISGQYEANKFICLNTYKIHEGLDWEHSDIQYEDFISIKNISTVLNMPIILEAFFPKNCIHVTEDLNIVGDILNISDYSFNLRNCNYAVYTEYSVTLVYHHEMTLICSQDILQHIKDYFSKQTSLYI